MKKTILAILLAFSLTAFISSCGVEEWPDVTDGTIGDTTTTVDDDTLPDPCNGNSNLCFKRFNEVSFAMTEKSYACESCTIEFLSPFQEFPVNRQLRDGIRAISLDVYEEGGALEVYYITNFLVGSQPFIEVLQEVESFMTENPREVVTIFLRPNGGASGTMIESDFDAAGLSDMTHSQERFDLWPKLVDMIAQNNRLVVFSNGTPSGSDPAWLMHEEHHVVSTEEQYIDVDQFNCTFENGDPFNQLFKINHFVSTLLPAQSKDAAVEANQYDLMYARVTDCQTTLGKVPNFVSVHWYDTGDVLNVVDTLNYAGPKLGID